MKKIILSLLVVSCTQTPSNNAQLAAQFAKKSESIIQMANQGKAAADVKQAVSELIEMARPLVNAYSSKHTDCRDYLKQVIAQEPHMRSLSLKEIEVAYHAGQALPEASESCETAKELLVHPVTALLVTEQDYSAAGRVQIVAELEELQEHFEDFQEL